MGNINTKNSLSKDLIYTLSNSGIKKFCDTDCEEKIHLQEDRAYIYA